MVLKVVLYGVLFMIFLVRLLQNAYNVNLKFKRITCVKNNIIIFDYSIYYFAQLRVLY